MNAGFMCVGTHGTVQIDETWINMVFIQKGTLSFTDQTISLSVNYIGESPIIFLRTGTVYVYPIRATRSGNTWTWTFFAADPAAGSSASVETATYYIFDKQPNVETHCGLNVYDGAGRVTFNSDYRPMRIVAIVAAPYSFGSTVSQAVAGGSGIYAATLPSPGFSTRMLTVSIGAVDHQGFRLAGGTTFQTATASSSGPPLNGGMGGGMAIVIDVGGL